MGDFSFPSLPDPKPLGAPLTAQSTVRQAGQPGTSSSEPQKLDVAVVAPDFKRQKIPLEKGFSQMDWLRLKSKGKDLEGRNLDGSPPGAPRRRGYVSMEEVRLHNTMEDGWSVINGVVYNMTPYVRFHPGGAAILKAVMGKDGTKLFHKYHSWVNVAALMDRCTIGLLDRTPMPTTKEEDRTPASEQDAKT